MFTETQKTHLFALVDGVRQPINGMERHFLRVTRGEARPASACEKEWLEALVARGEIKKTISSNPDVANEAPMIGSTKVKPAATRLQSEMKYALSQMTQQELHHWGTRACARLPVILARRAQNVFRLLAKAVDGIWAEFKDAFDAWNNGKLQTHLTERGQSAVNELNSIQDRASSAMAILGKSLNDNPGETAPVLLALVIGFFVGIGWPRCRWWCSRYRHCDAWYWRASINSYPFGSQWRDP